jgi:hypothetical protein
VACHEHRGVRASVGCGRCASSARGHPAGAENRQARGCVVGPGVAPVYRHGPTPFDGSAPQERTWFFVSWTPRSGAGGRSLGGRRQRRRLRHHGVRRGLRSRFGLRLTGRASHRRLERTHLLRRRVLLEKRRRPLVSILVLHGRLGVLTPARRHPLGPQPARLPTLSAARVGATGSGPRDARRAWCTAAGEGGPASAARGLRAGVQGGAAPATCGACP